MWCDDADDSPRDDEDADAEEDELEELQRGKEMWFALHDDGLWATFVTLSDELHALFVDRERVVYHEFLHEVMTAPVTSRTPYWSAIHDAVQRTASLYVLDVDPLALDAYVNKMLS